MKKMYYIKYEVTERFGHKYTFEKRQILKFRNTGKKAIARFEENYEETLKKNGIIGTCKVLGLAKERVQPKRTRGIPAWVKTLGTAVIFWAVLISLLWIAG